MSRLTRAFVVGLALMVLVTTAALAGDQKAEPAKGKRAPAKVAEYIKRSLTHLQRDVARRTKDLERSGAMVKRMAGENRAKAEQGLAAISAYVTKAKEKLAGLEGADLKAKAAAVKELRVEQARAAAGSVMIRLYAEAARVRAAAARAGENQAVVEAANALAGLLEKKAGLEAQVLAARDAFSELLPQLRKGPRKARPNKGKKPAGDVPPPAGI